MPSVRNLRQRRRVRRRFRQSLGVASAVGTLMALLVFMTMFGLFVSQYVPLWMTDNEAGLSTQVETQFGAIDQSLELEALNKGTLEVSSNPVTMQSGTVPVFATPTQGQLTFQDSTSAFMNASFNLTGLGSSSLHGNFHQNFTMGNLQMYLPDRYYVPVTYSISGGGLIQSQGSTQENMLFSPPWVLNSSGNSNYLNVWEYVMYSSTGSSSGYSAPGTAEVYTEYLSTQSYSGTGNLNITFETPYQCAWSQFLSAQFKGVSGLSYSPTSCYVTSGTNTVMHVTFTSLSGFTVNVVSFDVTVGLGNVP